MNKAIVVNFPHPNLHTRFEVVITMIDGRKKEGHGWIQNHHYKQGYSECQMGHPRRWWIPCDLILFSWNLFTVGGFENR